MGFLPPAFVDVEIRCDGACYGEHGYKQTPCYHAGDKAKKIVIGVPTGAANDLTYLLTWMPWDWAYTRQGFLCPECIRMWGRGEI